MKPARRSRPKVLVSACLLGKKVRYDGAHQRCPWAVKVLRRHASLIAVCPEVEMGLGVPRDTLRLVGAESRPGMRVRMTGKNLTSHAHRTFKRLLELYPDIDGMLLKSRSPSCGLNRVKVYPTMDADTFRRTGRGLFAGDARLRFPRTPYMDEKGAASPERRKRFLARILEHCRRRQGSTLK